MKIKELLRKIPVLFKILSFSKYKIYLPLRRGYVFYHIKYSLLEKKREIKKLKQLGFENIKIFEPLSWRIGKEKDRAYRRYYKAYYCSEQCFIKIGENDCTVKNEAQIYLDLKNEKIDFVSKILYIDMNFSDNTVLVANKFIENMRSIEKVCEIDEFKEICSSFCSVLDELKQKQIVHADIHKGNIMITRERKIILLDFGISIKDKKANCVDYKSRPGTFYILNEKQNIRTYDDAYSFVKMIELMNIPDEWENLSELKKVSEKIGCYSVDVTI